MTTRVALIGALALFAGSLALFWPGVATYDTVVQYAQVASGVYDDWHPPAMARLWAVVAALGPGTAPMLVLQLASYWAGLGLVSAALADGPRRAAAVLAIGVLPPLLGWQGVVLKDAQMAGALLAALGVVAWWRLRDRSVPGWAWAIVAVLAGYAVLVRANAVFAVVPLIVMLAPRPVGMVAKLGVGVLATLAILALSPVVNHRLLHAEASGVVRTQALFDLAGIAARTAPGAADTGTTAEEARAIVARGCATPFFWDPLGDEARCAPALERLDEMPVGALYGSLARAVVHHPLAYGAHRIAHLNSTERWLVPLGWPSASPPAESHPNTLRLGTPGAAARAWQRVTAVWLETPLGWPIIWVVVALAALATAVRRSRDGVRDVAVALLVSALALEASFAVLSIASDLRYHLWSMVATALAVVLIADRRPTRRVAAIGGAALLVVIGGGLAARIVLPPTPADYLTRLG